LQQDIWARKSKKDSLNIEWKNAIHFANEEQSGSKGQMRIYFWIHQ